MSGTATEFTAAAAARLESYLEQVRVAEAASDLDPADVAADVRDHVAAEFAAHTRPVALVELETVLAALGPPAGWAPAPPAGPTLRRRLLDIPAALWRGPEDWRLAYLCLLLTLLAVPTAGVSLLVAYLLGRAAVALAAERGQPLGARGWLVYPPLVAVSLPLVLALGFGPGAVALGLTAGYVDDARFAVLGSQRPPDDPRVVEARRLLDHIPVGMDGKPAVAGLFVAVGATLAWWAVLGLAWWAVPAWPPAVLYPLLNGYDGLHGVRLAACSGLGLVVWLGNAHRLGLWAWV